MNIFPLPLSACPSSTRPSAQKLKALRVSRIADHSAPHPAAGLMVISGRMADVCAELDRLVEQEQLREMRRRAA